MSKNLHVFNDPAGFFTNKTVEMIETIHAGQNDYLNTVQDCNHKMSQIRYTSIKDFLLKDASENYKLILFHSYNHYNQRDIDIIRARFPKLHLKFVWIFWSHEYYQLPEFFSNLYRGFSRKYLLRKHISFHVDHLVKFLKGSVNFPFYLGLKSLKKTYSKFDVMASLIYDDFKFVMNGIGSVNYQYISYISLKDFPEDSIDFGVDKTDIMVGHSGSPILNHYEIIKKLSDMNVSNKLYVPLAYGKASYIRKLQQMINTKASNLDITFQVDFISKEMYYRKIDKVGFFILNSYCQQALGNIFFFLWTGTKIFLRKETSTYITLTNKQFYVYSIDDDLNDLILTPLTPEQKKHNRSLVYNMINDDVVKDAWLQLLTDNESP